MEFNLLCLSCCGRWICWSNVTSGGNYPVASAWSGCDCDVSVNPLGSSTGIVYDTRQCERRKRLQEG